MTSPLRILIVDDEPLARERLRHLLADVEDVCIAGEAADGAEALRLVQALDPDVMILDIRMPGIDGLRVLAALDDPPAVIFSTAHEDHALAAFELEAVDYLLKPYSRERLARAIGRARRWLHGAAPPFPPQTEPVRIPAESGAGMELVPSSNVVLVRIESRVVFVLRDDGELLTSGESLQDLEDRLPPADFLRVSRRAIVNLRHVSGWEQLPDGGLRLRLTGTNTERVSRRRAHVFEERIGQALKS